MWSGHKLERETVLCIRKGGSFERGVVVGWFGSCGTWVVQRSLVVVVLSEAAAASLVIQCVVYVRFIISISVSLS